MLPQLADLDVSKLTEEARAALTAAQEIADGATPDEVAHSRGISAAALMKSIETLAAEFREQAGTSALRKLSDEEYEALRDSIAEYGQIYAILADVDGNIIDGRHRLRACRELGVIPTIQRLPAGTSADRLKCLSLVVNLARRQLTAGDRRGIIRDQLLRDATRSDRAIAAAVGVTHPTVAAVRRELEHTGQVERLSTRVGADGRTQTRTPAEPTPERELPDGVVDITLRVSRELAAGLKVGEWIDCKALRLVLIGPGTYDLQVRT